MQLNLRTSSGKYLGSVEIRENQTVVELKRQIAASSRPDILSE